ITDLEDVRAALERAWGRTCGRTGVGKALGTRARQLKDRLRPIVWRHSAHLRRFESMDRLITWLANSTKHQKRVPPVHVEPVPFTLPNAAATLSKMKQQRLAVPASEDPEVSIIVPAFNHFELTYACLEAIVAHTDGPSYEVIVVDDHSSDETPRMLASVDGVRVVRNERQLGFIGGCNAGAAVARGRYLVFLNND